jgi:hypothetical protein
MTIKELKPFLNPGRKGLSMLENSHSEQSEESIL